MGSTDAPHNIPEPPLIGDVLGPSTESGSYVCRLRTHRIPSVVTTRGRDEGRPRGDGTGQTHSVIPWATMNATVLDEHGCEGQPYRRLFELGRGGMARVYLAESLAFGLRKLVVLKVLDPELSADPEMRAAFRREAELSAQMNHPNVVQVMAVVESAGTPVIVMEYLEGTPLSMLLRRAGEHLPLRLRMHILSQVLAGLHHFHELRDLDGSPLCAVHRDMSPQNVMVLHDGPVKVLDFGIAKITAPDTSATRAGVVKGKLHYMPPEQLLNGAQVDRRADVFAVGVMLWEAVADRRMWEGKAELEVLRGLAIGALPSLRDVAPDAPASVLRIVARATERDRANRFDSAREMQEAIDQALAAEGWVVQPRELVAFMSRHFGEMRGEQQQKINDALRALRDADATADTSSRVRITPSLDTPGGSGVPLVRTSRMSVAHTMWRRNRVRVWGAALVGCLVLAGLWISRPEAKVPQPVSAAELLQTVAFEVEVIPASAQIVLDGKLLGTRHVTEPQPLSDNPRLLEVRAPGYVSQRKSVVLRKDTALQIVLQKESPTTLPTASASSPHASTGASTPRQTGAAARSHPRIPTKARVRSPECNPPYRFSADGVKTYKPECF